MQSEEERIYTICSIISIYIFLISPASPTLMSSGNMFSAIASPGEHFSHDTIVSLSADDPSPIHISVSLLDWYQSPNGGSTGIQDNPDMAQYSAKDFLTISPREFILSPGKSQDIKIEGEMPEGDGGRYAVVSARTVPNNTEKGVSYGLNTMILLTIKGSNIRETGGIENLSLTEPISYKQLNIAMIFKNTGNHHYCIAANLSLKDEKGSILATASPDIIGSIIPTAKRELRVSLTPRPELKPGNYIVSAEVALKDGAILATKEIKFEIK